MDMEKSALGIFVAALVLFMIGTFATIILPFYDDEMMATNKNSEARAYANGSPEALGREIYIREGCNTCHTQVVRPVKADLAAKTASEVLAAYGITILFAKEPVPWGAILNSLFERGALIGVMISGGDRPVEYNGVRLIQTPKRTLTQEDWKQWSSNREGENRRPSKMDFGVAISNEQIQPTSIMDQYISFLRKVVDIDRIKNSDLTICFDPLYGGGQGIINRLFRSTSRNIEELHQTRHSMFGGLTPSPNGESLHELIKVIHTAPKDVGIAWDAEGISWAWVNRSSGKVIQGHLMINIIRDYVAHKGLKVTDEILLQDGILQSLIFIQMIVDDPK